MKELSIEEKAKRYDEAIKIAKDINNEQRAQPFNVMTRVFPELAESEDERMKEAIIATIHLYYGEPLEDEAKKMIAWLEKQGEKAKYHDICDKCVRQPICQSDCFLQQGEQNPVVPKFKIGDKVKKGYLTYTVEDIDEDSYKLQAYSKDGDKGCTVFLTIGYEKDYELVEQKPEWSEKYIAEVFEKVGLAKIAREQGYDALTEAIQSAMIELSKFTPQPKLEWSEEDEKLINRICADLRGYALHKRKNDLHDAHRIEEEADWLKSLRPQLQWKPSDEQIEALDDFIYAKYPNIEKHGAAVKLLYQDLKKLREE